jgi:acyl carrier protein
MDREAVYLKIRDILVEQFEVEESSITHDANLYEELDIDSIDAVDLLVQLKSITGKKVDPEMFKDVRTIRDLLDALTAL